MRPCLIGLPYDASSSFLRGPAEAPPLIRAALNCPAGNSWTETNHDLSAPTGLTDAGDLVLPPDERARALIEAGVRSVLEAGNRPIALGGDHAVTYPAVRAVAAHHPGLTIVHIDAHTDLYEDFEGDRYSHACPFARIMEAGLASRLIQIGIRTQTGHLRQQAERFGVEVITMDRWVEGVRPRPEGAVYWSIDLDGIDPGAAPGVSHREPGGLSVREVITLIHELGGTMVGADVVEYNPREDLGGMTAVVAAKLVKELAGRIMSEASPQS